VDENLSSSSGRTAARLPEIGAVAGLLTKRSRQLQRSLTTNGSTTVETTYAYGPRMLAHEESSMPLEHAPAALRAV
jgi:hypothetical protein